MAMMPKTQNGLDPFTCLSAMQKCIRRGMEREAMEFAGELFCTSKAYATMCINRLNIIVHEDIGLANPQAVPFVYAACQLAKDTYDQEKPGKALMGIGNAIRLMCRSEKSREGDHFLIAVGLRGRREGYVPKVPDFAFDMHTHRGRKLGRGLDHFFKEAAKLDQEVKGDKYKKEAITRMKKWKGEE